MAKPKALQYRSIKPDTIMTLEIIGEHLQAEQEVYVIDKLTPVDGDLDLDRGLILVEHANGFQRLLGIFGSTNTKFHDVSHSLTEPIYFRLRSAA